LKKKFIGVYLLVLLIMSCIAVPFNLMNSFISATNIERLTFARQFGYASAWYTFRDNSGGTFSTPGGGSTNGYVAVINYKQLIIQILIITMIFVIIYLFLPNKWSTKKNIVKSNKEILITKKESRKEATTICIGLLIIIASCIAVSLLILLAVSHG